MLTARGLSLTWTVLWSQVILCLVGDLEREMMLGIPSHLVPRVRVLGVWMVTGLVNRASPVTFMFMFII
jgi:hypothetical protein